MPRFYCEVGGPVDVLLLMYHISISAGYISAYLAMLSDVRYGEHRLMPHPFA